MISAKGGGGLNESNRDRDEEKGINSGNRSRISVLGDDRISREREREEGNELIKKKQIWGGIGKK